jgi:hypothetical protein
MMRPVLQAEEALQAATVATIGSGHGQRDFVRETLKRWERIIEGGRQPLASDQPTPKTFTIRGIGIRAVPAKAKD